MEQIYKCCICKETFNGYGNNPDGAVWVEKGEIVAPKFKPDDRCCDECNSLFVIPGRLYKMQHNRN